MIAVNYTDNLPIVAQLIIATLAQSYGAVGYQHNGQNRCTKNVQAMMDPQAGNGAQFNSDNQNHDHQNIQHGPSTVFVH
jgi:hypothetical protein